MARSSRAPRSRPFGAPRQSLRVAILAEDGPLSACTRYRALQHLPRLTERLGTRRRSTPRRSRPPVARGSRSRRLLRSKRSRLLQSRGSHRARGEALRRRARATWPLPAWPRIDRSRARAVRRQGGFPSRRCRVHRLARAPRAAQAHALDPRTSTGVTTPSPRRRDCRQYGGTRKHAADVGSRRRGHSHRAGSGAVPHRPPCPGATRQDRVGRLDAQPPVPGDRANDAPASVRRRHRRPRGRVVGALERPVDLSALGARRGGRPSSLVSA